MTFFLTNKYRIVLKFKCHSISLGFQGERMFKKLILASIATLFVSSAYAGFDCGKLQSKIQKVESRPNHRAGKLQRLKDKYQAICVEGKSKQDWKAMRQERRGSYQSANRCGRLQRKLARAQQNGKQQKIDKILGKMQQHGCSGEVVQ